MPCVLLRGRIRRELHHAMQSGTQAVIDYSGRPTIVTSFRLHANITATSPEMQSISHFACHEGTQPRRVEPWRDRRKTLHLPFCAPVREGRCTRRRRDGPTFGAATRDSDCQEAENSTLYSQHQRMRCGACSAQGLFRALGFCHCCPRYELVTFPSQWSADCTAYRMI